MPNFGFITTGMFALENSMLKRFDPSLHRRVIARLRAVSPSRARIRFQVPRRPHHAKATRLHRLTGSGSITHPEKICRFLLLAVGPHGYALAPRQSDPQTETAQSLCGSPPANRGIRRWNESRAGRCPSAIHRAAPVAGQAFPTIARQPSHTIPRCTGHQDAISKSSGNIDRIAKPRENYFLASG